MNAWSADSTYAYYARLLQTLKSKYSAWRFRDAAAGVAAPGLRVFLRHDVDVSLRHAVRMAELEHEAGLASTFMILSGAAMYALKDAAPQATLRRLVALGHEVGLHFDCPESIRTSPADPSTLEASIAASCAPIEDILGEPVRSLSFHRPLPWLLRGPITIGGRINAYAAELMAWYLSDSKGSWREGEPLPMIEHPRGSLLQLLTHPIWWGQEQRDGPERLEEFLREETTGATPAQAAGLRRRLAETLPGVELRKPS